MTPHAPCGCATDDEHNPAMPCGCCAHCYVEARGRCAHQPQGPLPLSSPWADAVRENRHRVRCAYFSLTAILGSGVPEPDTATFDDHDALEMLADELERAIASWERRTAAGKP